MKVDLRTSRVSAVSDGNGDVATYSYLVNSPLVGMVTFAQTGFTRMTTGKQYDYLNRLTAVSSTPSAGSAVSFSYGYNTANQRVRDTLADGSYWLYQYDSLGQVVSANKYWNDETPVAGQQFDYTFDTIGNRTQTQTGGDSLGGSLCVANYYANTLNQITNHDVPGYVDVKGVSFATNTVTVNGTTAYRKTEYFRDELAVNNASSPLWTNIVTAATGQTSVTGNVYVAQEPEVFNYDADGNLTNDGRWAYIWDGENRLVTMAVNTNVGLQYQLKFAYDARGRRIQKIVTTNGLNFSTNRFLYDGWNLVAVLNTNSQLVSSYIWGSDLSGSQQGAGGVGSLLEVSYYGSTTTNCFPAFDGNGNVEALVNAADGTVAANYEYGPFGESIRITGVMAKANPFRFSTKYDDDESDLLYYGYRYYKPSTGTWPNRDPIGEQGGMNLYGFVGNSPLNLIDSLGRLKIDSTSDGFDVTAWGMTQHVGANGGSFSFDHTYSEANLPPLGGYGGSAKVNGTISLLHISQNECKNKYLPIFFHSYPSFHLWPLPPTASYTIEGTAGEVAAETGTITETASFPYSKITGNLKDENKVRYWGLKPCCCTEISLTAEGTLSGQYNDFFPAIALAAVYVGLEASIAEGVLVLVPKTP